MPYQVVWGQCNIFSAEGARETLGRGDYLPGELDETQVAQLATVGAVRFVDTALPPLPTMAVVAQSVPAEGSADPAEAADVPIPGELLIVGPAHPADPAVREVATFDGEADAQAAAQEEEEGRLGEFVPATDESEPETEDLAPSLQQEEGGQDGGQEGPAKPPQSAPKQEWVAYATASGLSESEAAGLSKADLVHRFG